jgi:hypothetical protein
MTVQTPRASLVVCIYYGISSRPILRRKLMSNIGK